MNTQTLDYFQKNFSKTAITFSYFHSRTQTAIPAKKVFIIFPGGPGFSSSYLHEVTEFCRRSGEVFTVDIEKPYLGLSDIKEELTNFSSFIQSSYSDIYYVGHSFGAKIIEELVKCQKKISPKLILIAPDFNDCSKITKEIERTRNQILHTEKLEFPLEEISKFTEAPNDVTFKQLITAEKSVKLYFNRQNEMEGKNFLKKIKVNSKAYLHLKNIFPSSQQLFLTENNLSTLILGAIDDPITPMLPLVQFLAPLNMKHLRLEILPSGRHFPWLGQDLFFEKLSSFIQNTL